MDECLADPRRSYTTREILERVISRCGSAKKVDLRTIQYDLQAIEREFQKKILRGREAGGRKGTVRYADQSDPIFFQELTLDEEEILREALKSLGQFEGLENFTWLELLRKKLEMPDDRKERPLISFSRNDILQLPGNILGQLFLAISGRKVIRFGYRTFADKKQPYQEVTVYPYQLRQYNDRWFLICNPVGNKEHPFESDALFNYALDRMDGKVEVIEDMPFVDTALDIDAHFEEIVGVTYFKDVKPIPIFFAVKPQSLSYVMTKYIHASQDEVNPETEKDFRKRYPSLKDCKFFSVYCRPNYELYSRFASYGDALVVVEPDDIRKKVAESVRKSMDNYSKLETV